MRLLDASAAQSASHLLTHYAMQYLATLDTEELIVQDCERKCLIEIAWRVFHSQGRAALDIK